MLRQIDDAFKMPFYDLYRCSNGRETERASPREAAEVHGVSESIPPTRIVFVGTRRSPSTDRQCDTFDAAAPKAIRLAHGHESVMLDASSC